MKKISLNLLQNRKSSQKVSLIIGNRIPKEFYITSGIGESDLTIHAGSYDAAVKDAGIHDFNIISYTSIIPKGASQIVQPKEMFHGSVLEAITAVSNSTKGQRATAGLIMGWIHNKKTDEIIGGLVAEYNQHDDEKTSKRILEASIKEMFESRYGNDSDYELVDIEHHIRSFVPKKKYGTAVVAICFANYEYPILGYQYSDNGKIITSFS